MVLPGAGCFVVNDLTYVHTKSFIHIYIYIYKFNIEKCPPAKVIPPGAGCFALLAFPRCLNEVELDFWTESFILRFFMTFAAYMRVIK